MKRILLGIVVIAGVAGVVMGVLFFTRQKLSVPETKLNQEEITPKKLPSKALKTYTDPSGFTFSYPEDVSVDPIDKGGSSVYTDLLFTSKDTSGSLSFNISDSKMKNVDEWFKQNSLGSTAVLEEATLGSMQAKTYSATNSMRLAALDQGVLFTVSVAFEGEKEFWTEVYKSLIASFSFTKAEENSATAASSDSTSEDVVFEGEEVIE